MFSDLKRHLQDQLPRLKGSWLHSNSGYEDDICRILEMEPSTCRYGDAVWNQYRIEFKKGRSIWLDLVRYSEISLGLNDDARKQTICLFFVPDKERSRIEEVICVETSALVEAIGLTHSQLESLMDIRQAVCRS